MQRRLDRERQARQEAEQLLEAKSTELFSKNEELQRVASILERQSKELQHALDRQKEINGLQRQFVSMVSHEFRTPLAIIDANAQRVLRRSSATLKDFERSALQKTRNAVVRLTELMESVLSTSRIEDGCIQLDPRPCSLAAIINEVAGSHAEIHPTHQINLDLDRLPDEIVADQKLLRQVFSNLLSNAIKYSPEGGNVWVDGTTDEMNRAVVDVRDEGLGIPESEQKKLFHRFFRASTSVGIAGTGIGLHLASHFVQLHQGKIDLKSREGAGSTFRVFLPISACRDADLPMKEVVSA